MKLNADKYLSKIDQRTDYIPLISSCTNLLNIFIKAVVLPKVEPKEIQKNKYFSYVQRKSFTRCLVLLIPGLGNLFVGIYDTFHSKWSDRDYVERMVKKDGLNLKFASQSLRRNPDIVSLAVEQNGLSLEFAHDNLRSNSVIIKKAVAQNQNAKKFAYSYLNELKNGQDFSSFRENSY